MFGREQQGPDGVLLPISFVALECDCHRLPKNAKTIPSNSLQHYRFPSTAFLFGQKRSFVDVSMGWSSEGIAIHVQVNHGYQESSYPNIKDGDSIELFIDTRDVKTSGFNTRFCHHFFFLPKPVEGHLAGELTHFRSDDAHPLCDPADLSVKASFQSGKYSLNIFIPSQCLHGYDPEQFERIGFNYRVNRGHDAWSQEFSAAEENYTVEQQPSLWGSVRLVE